MLQAAPTRIQAALTRANWATGPELRIRLTRQSTAGPHPSNLVFCLNHLSRTASRRHLQHCLYQTNHHVRGRRPTQPPQLPPVENVMRSIPKAESTFTIVPAKNFRRFLTLPQGRD